MDKFYKELKQKLTHEDSQKIWMNFRRFAEYDSLKDLYNKCIPEIARFQTKISEFERTMTQNSIIIRRFDEVVSTKSSKNDFDKLAQHVDETYVKLASIESFKFQIRKDIDSQEAKLSDSVSMLERVAKNI